jgi:hypothetical protein
MGEKGQVPGRAQPEGEQGKFFYSNRLYPLKSPDSEK